MNYFLLIMNRQLQRDQNNECEQSPFSLVSLWNNVTICLNKTQNSEVKLQSKLTSVHGNTRVNDNIGPW